MDTSTTDFAHNAADTRNGFDSTYGALRQNSADDAVIAKKSQLDNKVTETFQGAMQGAIGFLMKGGKDPGAIFSMAFAAFRYLDASAQKLFHDLESNGLGQPSENDAETKSSTRNTAAPIALALGRP